MVGLLVVWPVMVAGTAAATYLIVVNNDLIIQRLGFGFAPLVMLSLVSVISGMLCTMSVLTENWHPRMRTNVSCPLTFTPVCSTGDCPLHDRFSPALQMCRERAETWFRHSQPAQTHQLPHAYYGPYLCVHLSIRLYVPLLLRPATCN